MTKRAFTFPLLYVSAIQQSDDPAVQDLHPERTIYVHGCMTVLGRRLRRDVLPLLLTYIGCAVLLALIQILSLVLARWVALMSTVTMSSLVLFYFVLWPCCNNLCRIPFSSAYAAAISRKNRRPESRAGQYAPELPPLLQQAKPGEICAYLHSLNIVCHLIDQYPSSSRTAQWNY